VRKGVLDLAKAIPIVLERRRDVRFRLIGPDDESPRRHLGMRDYLRQKLRRCLGSVELLPPVPNDRLYEIFGETDVVVVPSVWENFANVCLESMAAARAVIASDAGGMAEMLDFGDVGRLIPPCRPDRLAEAILELVAAPDLRLRLGEGARQRIIDQYNVDRIGLLQEQSYHRAIVRRKAAGRRAI
jgi:glycosyltransferase involved in cell wall biosynthesis